MGASHLPRWSGVLLATLVALSPLGVRATASGGPAPARLDCMSPPDRPFKVGSLVWDAPFSFLEGYVLAQQEAAACLGIELDIQDDAAGLSAEVAAIERFIDQGVGLIILLTIEAEGIVPAIRLANEAGIPVIVALYPIAEGADILTFVGHDEGVIGHLQGEMLVAELGGTGRLGLASGGPWDATVEEGLRSYLADHPGIEVVEAGWGGENETELLSITETWLDTYARGELAAIIAQSTAVIPAARLAAQRGRDDVRFFAGFHSEQVDDAIAEGLLAGAVIAEAGPLGVAAVEDAWLWLSGQPDRVPRPDHFLEPAIVTRANVDEYPTWVPAQTPLPAPTPLPVPTAGPEPTLVLDPEPTAAPSSPRERAAFDRRARRTCLRARPRNVYGVTGRPDSPRSARGHQIAHLVLVEYRDLGGTRRREPRLVQGFVYDLGSTQPFAWASASDVDVLACVALRATRRESWRTLGTQIFHTIDAADAIIWVVDADDGRRIGRPWLRRPPGAQSGQNRILFGEGGPGVRPPLAADIVADVVRFLGR